MNVYDFDKTIYDGDSSIDLFLWLIPRHPKMLLNLPRTAAAGLSYLLHLCSKTQMKQNFYRALKQVPDLDSEVKIFWDSHIEKIYPWYYDQQREDDIIISASPEFDIGEACARLGIKTWMASRVDKKNGTYDGLNCHGEEKVRRLKELILEPQIENFYSDSFSDAPLAKLAEKAWLIKDGQVIPWPEGRR
ncbi:MAG: HAD-IB family phosphatase [Erysipelotrichaceae bacterium]|nr:HAD-IB family phosphatase [Erysipelotrichaceae bacterium]